MAKLRIIVGGLIGRAPVGGWHYLQYVAGLARLGHDVYYHEDTWCWPYDPIQNTHTDDATYSAAYLDRFFATFAPQASDRWHYLHLHRDSYGMEGRRFAEVARSADIFLNIGGASFIPDELSPRCVKVFLDTDPGYNQIVLSERFDWSENVDQWARSIEAHDLHFTYAENIDGADCQVPRLGFRWQPTRPPVVLDLWLDIAAIPPPRGAPWTTIMTWNPFKGRLLYGGREYGGKELEFEKIIGLPLIVDPPLKVAVGGVNAPLERLAAHGWQVVDGPSATVTPQKYREFIAASRGEFSCAKQIYVALRTGWFSERTICYLASGRPAVVQDTGFSPKIPIGEGLFGFSDAEEARVALATVESDYERHARAAREVAMSVFDSDIVLARLIDRISQSNA